eukprot:3319378-Karenia_brevis.AAC.1
MIRVAPAQDEEWPVYIHRWTHLCETVASKYGSTDWIYLQRKRTWDLAGKSACRSDGRWSCKLLDWKPWFRCQPYRRIGHPCKRWTDSLAEYAGPSWKSIAHN